MKKNGSRCICYIQVLLLFSIIIAACNPSEIKNIAGVTPIAQTPSLALTPLVTVTPTYPCLLATQESPPRVDPVTSPTNEDSQAIRIHGNFDQATVETESGTFTGSVTASQGIVVNIKLLPNTIHHLKVIARVHQSNYGGCTYGGYDMTVLTDTNGLPLEIVQGTPATPSPVTEALGPATINRVKLIRVISLANGKRPSAAFFNASDQLISFGLGQGVSYWNTPSGTLDHEFYVNMAWMTVSAAISPDGNWLATGGAGSDPGDDNQTYVRVWDLTTGQPRYFGHQSQQVVSLAFNPSSTLLASGGNDNTIYLWDVVSDKQLARFDVQTTVNDEINLRLGVTQLAWVDDSSLLIHANGAVLLWKIPSGEQVLSMDDQYLWMDYHQQTNTIALLRKGCIQLTRLPDNQPITLADNPANCQDYKRANFNQDGSLLVAQNDQKITFWDIQIGQVVYSGKNPIGSQFILSPDWYYQAQINWDDQRISLWGVQP